MTVTKAKTTEPVKNNGCVIHYCKETGLYLTSCNPYGSLANLDGLISKYDTRFDDPTYYNSSLGGGGDSDPDIVDVGEDDQENNGGTTLTFNKPAGAQEGDYAIVLISGPLTVPAANAAPTGWEFIHPMRSSIGATSDPATYRATGYIYVKKLTDSEPDTYVFNFGSATPILMGKLNLFRNVTLIGPEIHNQNFYESGATSISSWPSRSTFTTIDNCVIVRLFAVKTENGNKAAPSSLSGHTLVGSRYSVTSGSDLHTMSMFRVNNIAAGTNTLNSFNLDGSTGTTSGVYANLVLVPKKYFKNQLAYFNDLETGLDGISLSSASYVIRTTGQNPYSGSYNIIFSYDSTAFSPFSRASITKTIGSLGGTFSYFEMSRWLYGSQDVLVDGVSAIDANATYFFTNNFNYVKRSVPIAAGQHTIAVSFIGDAEQATNQNYRIDDIHIGGVTD